MANDTRIAPRRDELITSDNRMTRRFAEFLEEQAEAVNALDEKSGVQDSLIALSNRQRGKITNLEQEVEDLKEMIFELSARKKPPDQEPESGDGRFSINILHNKITSLISRLDDVEAEATHITLPPASLYEEGVWTPALGDGTNTATHSIQNGTYTKVGRMVHVRAYLVTTSLTGDGTVAGAAIITGLPYPSSTVSSTHSPANFGYAFNMNLTAGYSLGGFVEPSSAHIKITNWDVAAGTSFLDATEWSATGAAILDAVYYI